MDGKMDFYIKNIIVFCLMLCMHFSSKSQSCHIRNYTTADGLPQNNITHLMLDKSDKLWIGTQGGLCVFDGQKISPINHTNLSARIFYIHKDQQGEVYICDGNQNIYQINDVDNNLVQLNQKNETYFDWTLDYNEYDLFINEDEKNHYRSFILNKMKYKNFKVFQKNNSSHYFTLNSSFCAFKEYFMLDTMLIATTYDGQWIKQSSGSYINPINSDLPSDFYSNGFIFNSDEYTFWIYRNSIYVISLMGNKLTHKLYLSNINVDPIKDQITSAQYNTNTGIFYFGSSKFGLFEIKKSFFSVKKHTSFNNHPLIIQFGHAYYSQAEFDTSSILVNNYIVLDSLSDTILSNVIYPFNRAVNMIDKNGRLWNYDNENVIISNKNNIKKISLTPLSTPIQSMCQISENRYLIIHPYYIIEVDSSQVLSRIPLGHFKESFLEYGQYIYFDDKTHRLFILSNKKTYTYDYQNSTLIEITSLPEADYRIMTPLKDNIHFIGTYGQGYLIFDGQKWTQMPLDIKGHLKFAHAALCDSNGHVWISTNNGLFRTRLQNMIDYADEKSKDIYYYYYDKSSGFLTNEFNGGCQSPAIKLKNGKFSFSSMDGLVQFDPLKVPAIFPDNPVQILHLWLNKKLQDTIPETLKVSQDIKEIKLEVSTAFYGHPDNLEIQYKIPGYVDEWQDITDKRYIMIQNAKHGMFNIEIRKRRGFGNNDFDYISYSIEVLPYFYQTWWFVSILIVLGFLLSYLFSRWYNRYMIQKNKELEALIAEKNAGLIQINKTLTEKIKQNDLFQSILVHDIKSPLRFIVSTTKLILNFWPSVTDEIKKENISHINESASKIGNFVEETLLWIQIRNGEHEPQLSNVNINDILKENVTLYQEDPKILSNDITVHIDCLDELYMNTDSSLISTIIRNLLSNSIKYSERGKIILYAYQEKNNVIFIGCKDEGKGLDQKTIDAILSDDYKGNTIRKDSFRLGYVIIKEILRLLNGKLHIRSTSHLGSDICMIFEQHYY